MVIEETFLSAFLQVLFDRLASKHVLDFVRGHDIENDLKGLKKTLKKVNVVLNDAEDKQFKDEEVKMWLDELKDAAYDAEDVLDEFATEVALRQNLQTESQTILDQVRSWIPNSLSPNVRSFNDEIESKIKAITERFDELANQRYELGLKEVAAGKSSSIVRETTSLVDESGVYGRDNDKEKIIELLLKDEPKFSVIPIVGMGGVGKTTLAQIVYNDNKVERHFDLKAWACVSEEFDVKRITKTILSDITSGASDSDNLNQVQVKLKNALFGKKFLIVLDDVRSNNYDDWHLLQNPFRAGAPGSKIIVTTRITDIALMMKTVDNHHNLEHLSNDDCWLVFVQHAFGSRNIDTKPNLATIGKKIVEKCKGLPLAAKSLGGLLRNKLEEDEWEDILNSKIWELPKKESDILPALKLSYHHLPSHLKRCFAYCSIFPKDYEFQERKLVLLWMAEGLVQPNGRKPMEDLAAVYFRDLLSRSFFQLSSSDKSLFVMHDLINDLAQQVAGETCFRLEGKEECIISKKARHSSYVGVEKLEAFYEVEGLRTFLPLMIPSLMKPGWRYLPNYVPLNLLQKLRRLRVLSLDGYYITELPDSIGDLKLLRYLDLSRTRIRCLPESTSTLYNLQTLMLKDCVRLEKFPTTMVNLINLRLLDITNANLIEEMPPGVGKFTSLRKLSNFIVGKNSRSGIRELMNLKYLRGTLNISSLENVIDARDARDANLKEKKDLDVLIIEWSSEFNDSRNEGVEKEVLDMLQPHKKLKELTIRCYGGFRLPTWVGDPSFSNMVLLSLNDCKKCTSLPPLGQLPSLKDLCIEGMNEVESVDLEFYGDGCPKPFPSLETLRFENMTKWKEWFPFGVDRQVEVFPCLRKLFIIRCPKLSGKLPEHLPSLEILIIDGCQQLTVTISSLPNLYKLDIKECQEVVHRSTVSLSSLKSMGLSNISKLMCLTEEFMQGLIQVEDLKIVGCGELKSLRQKEGGLLRHLTSLCTLNIEGCPNLVSLVAEEVEEEEQLGLPCRLESLRLYQCKNLEKLQGLHSLTSLKMLTIRKCPSLVSFPETILLSMLREVEIADCWALKSLPQAMMHGSLEYLCIEKCSYLTSIARGQLPSTLKRLRIVTCKNLQSLVDEEEGSSTTTTTYIHNNSTLIEHLYIERCPSLKSISSRGELPATLKYLFIYFCPKLESLAGRLHNNTSLESISIWKCESLKSLPDGLHKLSRLYKFLIENCPSLVSFPDGGLPTTNLRELYISECEKLEALPYRMMHNLTSLQKLSIAFFPEEGFPTNLTELIIGDLKICKPLSEWGLNRLTSLTQLHIEGRCPDLVSFPEEEGMNMILPTSLTRLTIGKFPNLENLSSKGFQNLNSLVYMKIFNCPKLKAFPEEGLPPSLLQLCISDCPLLEQQCKKDQGRGWPKIAHIPDISIDGQAHL